MPRLINADIAINMISEDKITDAKVLNIIHNLGNVNEVETLNMACDRHIQMIDQLPTVDAVPVVRCKDCKWYEIAQLKRDGTDDKRYKPSVCVIGRFVKPRNADWFCADGERGEDANSN